MSFLHDDEDEDSFLRLPGGALEDPAYYDSTVKFADFTIGDSESEDEIKGEKDAITPPGNSPTQVAVSENAPNVEVAGIRLRQIGKKKSGRKLQYKVNGSTWPENKLPRLTAKTHKENTLVSIRSSRSGPVYTFTAESPIRGMILTYVGLENK